MGTRIEAVSTSRPRRRFGGTGAIRLANDAARACLERAGRTAGDVDFLINAGVYRDNNIGEPAVASIIQQDISASPEPPIEGGRGTFSFDVINGAVGVLSGIHILDGFLSSGAIDVALVVAADQDPDRGSHWDFPFGLVGASGRVSRRGRAKFPFPAIGGAMLLSREEDESKGFSRFAFTSFPEYRRLFTSEVLWKPRPLPGLLTDALPRLSGRNVLRFEVREGFTARAVDCALATVGPFLESAGLRASELDLVVPSPSPEGFADGFTRALGVSADRVAHLHEGLAGAHTAGPIAAFEEGIKSGRLADSRNVLFVAIGAGLSVGLALYHP
jgi:3-oxoacyl-[acyl-carrier-protein] synthase III